MTSSLEALVERLAEISLDEYLDEPERLNGALSERQNVILELQKADASQVTPDVRAQLKARLRAVLERDAQLLAQLEQLREETRRAIAQLSHGRAAARGYSERPAAPPSAHFHRIG